MAFDRYCTGTVYSQSCFPCQFDRNRKFPGYHIGSRTIWPRTWNRNKSSRILWPRSWPNTDLTITSRLLWVIFGLHISTAFMFKMIALTWILGVIMAFPVFERSRIEHVGMESPAEVQCGIYWGVYENNCTVRQERHCECGFLPAEGTYKTQLFIFTFLLPLSIICFCYFNIGKPAFKPVCMVDHYS